MVMHYQTQDMENGIMPSPEKLAAIEEYMREAAMSGVLLSGEGVGPSSAGARVEVTDGKVRVIDGPFAEAKELIGGFAILEVDSLVRIAALYDGLAQVSPSPVVELNRGVAV